MIRNNTVPVVAALGACLLLFVAAASSHATIINNYGPFTCTFYNNGEGDGSGQTGQQDWTQMQIDDVAYGINQWASKITDVPGRQVTMHLFWYNYSGGTLGGSSSYTIGDSTTAWNLGEYVYREGSDYTPSSGGYYSDTKIVYDTDAAGFAWNFGEGAPSSSQIDFRSVITHEIGHSLGFVTTYQSGSDTFWAGGLTEFSKYLIDDAGNRPLAGSTGTPGDFNQLDNPVWFTGPHAMAANGGNPVPIYAPSTYASGRSLGHVDETQMSTDLMSPFTSLGPSPRSPSAVDWGIMQDMGWSVAVPEPSSLALLGATTAGLIVCAFGRGARARKPTSRV